MAIQLATRGASGSADYKNRYECHLLLNDATNHSTNAIVHERYGSECIHW